MVMNMYILFLVSLPEAFLNLIIALLITGRKDTLKINRNNIVRFTASLFLMLLSSCIIRPVSPNIIINVTLHIIAYSLIFMLVYRMKPVYALFGTAFFLMIITATEVIYTPYVITYVFNGLANFQEGYHWYVLLSLPQRSVQALMIVFLWKHEVLLVTRINCNFHRLFLASFLLLVFGEQLLYFIFISIFEKLQVVYQITFSASLFIIVLVLNFLIFKLIYTVIGGLVVKSYNKYSDFEDDVKFALGEIRDLLINNQVEEAVKLIDDLNG
ncbi:hypothetical protein LY28_01758 [Ruminiclostridium sufflavum DSM 19573]|uniref:Uncharacterized protein n=1 Tax=Ruminiclostridium sufflavum DSM 19573 TaxID=1121337 RepID=A0A318XNT0_9FIRM|nr:hypothetical protein [Ruminiclostridium sufflavum]PYG87738.1 hypothetical protein LY28_01758 [Ruminiclostridium sufflavum DSM 19573]